MNKIRVSSDRMYPYSAITPVPKGQVKFSKIQFYLSDDWNGRNTIAQFQQGEKTRNKALNSDNTCYIPSDFDIGIVTVYLKGYSLDGFSIATANGVSIPIVQGAFDGGDPAVPPEPDLYQKLIQSIQQTTGDLNNLKTEDRSSLVAAINEVKENDGGGTSDHDNLLGRDKENQHPMSAITGLEDALAGKQPTGSYLTKETDPTVPAWAKAETKPSYTAPEVGADPSGTATARVSAHNTEATAHSDMRLLIQGLTDRLNALADSDDTTLDQLSEVVAYIKNNRDLIAAITTDKVSVGDIVNDLVTNVANKPLSAAQGVALKALIDSMNASDIGAIPAPATASVGQTIVVKAVDENGRPTEWETADNAWKLISSGELIEDTAYFEFDGLSDYKELIFSARVPAGVSASVQIYANGAMYMTSANYFMHPTVTKQSTIMFSLLPNFLFKTVVGQTVTNSPHNAEGNIGRICVIPNDQKVLNSIKIMTNVSGGNFLPGTTYALFGR